jgi:hypothetical protein
MASARPGLGCSTAVKKPSQNALLIPLKPSHSTRQHSGTIGSNPSASLWIHSNVWLPVPGGRRFLPAMPRRPPGPIATLGELHQTAPRWFWAHCSNGACRRRRAMPLAPFVIAFGQDASSDVLRRNLKCAKCGHRGVSLQHPSWLNSQDGEQPFPREQEQ